MSFPTDFTGVYKKEITKIASLPNYRPNSIVIKLLHAIQILNIRTCHVYKQWKLHK